MIGFDAKRAFHNFTGLGNYSRTLLSNLAEFYPDQTYTLFTPDFTSNARTKVLEKPPFRIVSPETTIMRKLPGYWRSGGLLPQLKANNINVYHGLSHEVPSNLRQNGITSVVSMHDIIFERFPHFYKFADRQIYRYKFKEAVRLANKVVAISQQTAQDLNEFYKVPLSDIQVVYQTADPIFEQAATPEQQQNAKVKYKLPDTFLLYVGSVNERKNLNCLLEVLKNLPNEVHLVVVGSGGAYYRKMRDKAIADKTEARIIWLDNPNFFDFPAIYSLAQIFVLPSYFEGFGIPVIEALWSGTPVIASSGTCFEEAAGSYGTYLPPNNIEAWTENILQLLQNGDLRRQKSKEGLIFVSNKFSRQKTSQQWMQLYSELA